MAPTTLSSNKITWIDDITTSGVLDVLEYRERMSLSGSHNGFFIVLYRLLMTLLRRQLNHHEHN